MTIQDWRKDDELAMKLAEELRRPIIAQALLLLQEMSMAKSLNGPALLEIKNTKECFGYDVGRASVFRDLQDLATIVPKATQQLETNYGKTTSTPASTKKT